MDQAINKINPHLKMKKIIIFLVFFTSSQALAQATNRGNQVNNANNIGAPTRGSNVVNVAPVQPEIDSKRTLEEKAVIEKKLAEQKDFEASLKKLTPAEQKQFQIINQDFSSKMIEYEKNISEFLSKVSKIKSLVAIDGLSDKKNLDVARSDSKEMQNFYQQQNAEYQKLSPDAKKLIKQEFIKYRKNVNALEKKRRQEFKILFKKDFEIFKENDSDAEIEAISKL